MQKYKGTVAYHRVYAELIAAATAARLTSYQAIARAGGLPAEGHAMAQATGAAMCEINDQEIEEGRPMLSLVCVGANGRPGEGFFAYARLRGRLETDTKAERDALFKSELDEVYVAWSRL